MLTKKSLKENPETIKKKNFNKYKFKRFNILIYEDDFDEMKKVWYSLQEEFPERQYKFKDAVHIIIKEYLKGLK